MAGSWLFRPLPLRERVGRGVAPVSSTLRTRRLVVPSPPHPNPLPRGEREPEAASTKGVIANSTVLGLANECWREEWQASHPLGGAQLERGSREQPCNRSDQPSRLESRADRRVESIASEEATFHRPGGRGVHQPRHLHPLPDHLCSRWPRRLSPSTLVASGAGGGPGILEKVAGTWLDSIIVCHQPGGQALDDISHSVVQPGDAQLVHGLRAGMVQARLGDPEHVPVRVPGLGLLTLVFCSGSADVGDRTLDGQLPGLEFPDLRRFLVAGAHGRSYPLAAEGTDRWLTARDWTQAGAAAGTGAEASWMCDVA